MAIGAAPRGFRIPFDLAVGLVSMAAGVCLVGWALFQPTLGGMIVAGSGALMVFVGAAKARRAARTPAG
jgi:hypothetical protein